MSSSNPEPSDTKPTLQFDPADIANSGPFMDSLVEFLNEACTCMLKVKSNAGIAPGCPTPVPMNDDEKKDTMNSILTALGHKCQKEVEKDEASDDDSGSINECACPPPELNRRFDSSRSMPTGRRVEMQRPATGAMRARGPSPGQYSMAGAHSAMSALQPNYRPCPSYPASRSEPRGRPNMMDPRAVSGAYHGTCPPECGPPPSTSQSRRRPY